MSHPMLIFVWGQLTIFPLLTPLVLWPILYIFHRIFLRPFLTGVNAALIFFVGVSIVVAAIYYNFDQGLERYADFLARKGVEESATVSSVRTVTAIPQFEKADEVRLKLIAGKKGVVEVSHQSETRRFFPLVEDTIPAPAPGDQLRIRYYPGAEEAFLVMTESDKSSYGMKLFCIRMNASFGMAQKRFSMNDYPDPEMKKAFRLLVEERLKTNCPVENERARLNEQLLKL